jgi:hypothetical protein
MSTTRVLKFIDGNQDSGSALLPSDLPTLFESQREIQITAGGVIRPDETGALEFNIPAAASADYDFTLGEAGERYRIVDAKIIDVGAGNDGTSSTKLQTAASAADITNAMPGSATDGTIARATLLKNNVILGGGVLRVHVVKGGAVTAAFKLSLRVQRTA